jgi:hypothetical protein
LRGRIPAGDAITQGRIWDNSTTQKRREITMAKYR